MKIINSSFKIITSIDDSILKRIELYGRICYKSEDKITDNSAKLFCKKLIKEFFIILIFFINN